MINENDKPEKAEGEVDKLNNERVVDVEFIDFTEPKVGSAITALFVHDERDYAARNDPDRVGIYDIDDDNDFGGLLPTERTPEDVIRLYIKKQKEQDLVDARTQEQLSHSQFTHITIPNHETTVDYVGVNLGRKKAK